MGTPYSKVYNAYFLRVKDDIYQEMDSDELEIELQQILEAALPRFSYPKVNLEEQDEEGFAANLTLTEVQIIATLMNLIWAETKISDIEVVRQVYRDHDFQMTSQASHLRALMALRQDLEVTAKNMMHKYYMTDGREADLSGLAGG